MSRFSSHHVQSTSTSTSMTATSTQDPNGDHCASPYLRRFRIPKLNTFRHHLEQDEDDDEWFEVQMAKNDLIQLRMKEMSKNRLKDRTNNNNPPKKMTPSTNESPVKQSDVQESNGNRCPAEENSAAMDETQTTMRCLWFHPKHLFNFASSPSPTTVAGVSEN